MIDTHCHLDVHDDPIGLAGDFEARQNDCVAVTALPSHYRLAIPHLKRFSKVHAALGLHPLRVNEGQKEVNDFILYAEDCNFIGEVGLDFSREGYKTKKNQIEVLLRIIDTFKNGKFVSIHSRGAAYELIDILDQHMVKPVCFHYFTDGLNVASVAVKAGHYFSFNHRMLNGVHKGLLDIIPQNRVLVESDAPFLSQSPISDLKKIYSMIAEYWNLSLFETINLIAQNFINCRTVG